MRRGRGKPSRGRRGRGRGFSPGRGRGGARRGRGTSRGGRGGGRGNHSGAVPVGEFLELNEQRKSLFVRPREDASFMTSSDVRAAARELDEFLQRSHLVGLGLVVMAGGEPRARGSIDASALKELMDAVHRHRDQVRPRILRLHANQLGDEGVDVLTNYFTAMREAKESAVDDVTHQFAKWQLEQSAEDETSSGRRQRRPSGDTGHHSLRELHLSHNAISTDAALRLLSSLIQLDMYPVRIQGRMVPLWLRLEYNRIDTDRLRASLDAWVSSLCEVPVRDDFPSGCGPRWCALELGGAGLVPAFHTPFLGVQLRDLADLLPDEDAMTRRRSTQKRPVPARGPVQTTAAPPRQGEWDGALRATVEADALPPLYLVLDTNSVIQMLDEDRKQLLANSSGRRGGDRRTTGFTFDAMLHMFGASPEGGVEADTPRSARQEEPGSEHGEDEAEEDLWEEGEEEAEAEAWDEGEEEEEEGDGENGNDAHEDGEDEGAMEGVGALDGAPASMKAAGGGDDASVAVEAGTESVSSSVMNRSAAAAAATTTAGGEEVDVSFRGWGNDGLPVGEQVQLVLIHTVATELDGLKHGSMRRLLSRFLNPEVKDRFVRGGILNEVPHTAAEAVIVEEGREVAVALDGPDRAIVNVARFLRGQVVRRFGWDAFDRVVLVSNDRNMRVHAPRVGVPAVSWDALHSAVQREAMQRTRVSPGVSPDAPVFSASFMLHCLSLAGVEGLTREEPPTAITATSASAASGAGAKTGDETTALSTDPATPATASRSVDPFHSPQGTPLLQRTHQESLQERALEISLVVERLHALESIERLVSETSEAASGGGDARTDETVAAIRRILEEHNDRVAACDHPAWWAEEGNRAVERLRENVAGPWREEVRDRISRAMDQWGSPPPGNDRPRDGQRTPRHRPKTWRDVGRIR